VKHDHRECTEVYYILEGQGKMELNDDDLGERPAPLSRVPRAGWCATSQQAARRTSRLTPAVRQELLDNFSNNSGPSPLFWVGEPLDLGRGGRGTSNTTPPGEVFSLPRKSSGV